nr:hypothetical protein [Tanacetum cinerariifolium]
VTWGVGVVNGTVPVRGSVRESLYGGDGVLARKAVARQLDLVKCDYLDEFYGPFIPIHIFEEERIRREHADYINRMEMLFTINPRPHNLTNDNRNVESFSSLPIPIQESDPRQEEIDVVSVTDYVLPLSVDSDEEVDTVDVLRVDNFI